MPGLAPADTSVLASRTSLPFEPVLAIDSLHELLEQGRTAGNEPDSITLPSPPPPVPTGVKIQPFDYTSSGKEQLHHFLSSLAMAGALPKSIRIMHYGDSQIEGDRITSYLRSRLQNSFGGAGVGMVSLVPPMYPPYGMSITNSSDWRFFSMMPAHRRVETSPYGIMGSVCQLVNAHTDSLGQSFYQGTVTVKRSPKAGRGMQFTQCGVLMRNEKAPTEIALSVNDSIYQTEWCSSSPEVQLITMGVSAAVSPFTLRFRSRHPPDIFAISYQTPEGIQVDNLPLRGSSGDDFTAIPDQVLVESAALLEPKLIILQFGANVVPSQLASYSYYREMLTRQIERLKRLMPAVSFILIGVSDMGMKEGEHYRSYPNIARVRNAQREAAFATGIAFWDTYEAMGGENSIISWVKAKPPLATSDYVHFTPRGARFVGEMFYAALLAEYSRYIGEGKNRSTIE